MRALILCALTFAACVAPPPSWHIEGEELMTNDAAWKLRWRTEPAEIPLNEPFVIEAQVLPSDGSRPPKELSLEADAAMPEHRHGMNRLPRMIDLGDGRFRAEGMLFLMEGRWELYFDVTTQELTERGQTEVHLD